MKIQYDYYTQTTGFPDVKITLTQARKICMRFGIVDSKSKLQDPNNGFIKCSDRVTVWSEEKMNYNKRRK